MGIVAASKSTLISKGTGSCGSQLAELSSTGGRAGLAWNSDSLSGAVGVGVCHVGVERAEVEDGLADGVCR